MILGFQQQFVPKILAGTKIHTIRRDEANRWKAGKTIHFSTGVRSVNYKQFIVAKCTSVQSFKIKYPKVVGYLGQGYPEIYIDGKYCDLFWREKLAKRDGFDSLNDFYEWFNTDFQGKIIHWTDCKY